MRYNNLGATGIQVSAVSLGTVALGVDYGIRVPGHTGIPSADDAVALLRRAATAGISLFDTAPAYGASEQLLGNALDGMTGQLLATKVSLPVDGSGSAVVAAVEEQVLKSLRALRRDVVDIVQMHNVTQTELRDPFVRTALVTLKQRGDARFIGASVYGEEDALAAIDTGWVDVIQIAYNIFDQRMGERVFAAAGNAGVGVVVRSALLKGALTPLAQWLPDDLAPLRDAVAATVERLSGSWDLLPEFAIRFCLSQPNASSVLVGIRDVSELKLLIDAAAKGPLPAEELRIASELALDDEALIDPRYWDIP